MFRGAQAVAAFVLVGGSVAFGQFLPPHFVACDCSGIAVCSGVPAASCKLNENCACCRQGAGAWTCKCCTATFDCLNASGWTCNEVAQ